MIRVIKGVPMVTMGQWSGRETRILRQALRLTVRQFAEDLGVSPRTVTKWEALGAARIPRPELQAALDTMLTRATSEQCERFDIARSGEPVRPWESPASVDVQPLLDPQPSDRTLNCSQSEAELSDDIGMSAREVLPLPATCDLAIAVVQEARFSARFTHVVTLSSIEKIALEQLSADIRRLARSFISAPLSEIFGEICYLRREVTGAVTRNKYPNQLRELYLDSGRLSGLMAHVCLDLGDYPSADTHARASWFSADLAGHTEMQAWARALQSLVAYWDERYDDAIGAAEDGLRYVRNGTVVVRLHGLQARAHARRQDQSAALAALEAADSAREQVAHPDEIAGMFTFPEAKQAAYAGTTLVTLDRPDLVRRGIAESERALVKYQQGAPRDRSMGDILAARLDLVSAYVASESLDGAETELAHVLATPASKRTASIVRRSLAISNELTRPRYATSGQAIRMRANIANFTADGGGLTITRTSDD